MAQSIGLIIKTERVASEYTTDKGGEHQASLIQDLFRDAQSGARNINVDVFTSTAAPVAASATLTLASAIATDAVTIGTVTFTGSDTPSGVLQFDTNAGSDALIAASLAETINAHPVAGEIVSASASGDVVTVTCKQKGVIGNQIPISSADATITASGAFLTGGTGGLSGTAQNYSLGL